MPASVCRPPAVPSVAASSSELPKVFPAVAEVAGVPELVDALAHHVAELRAAGQLPPPRKRRRRRRTSAK